MVLLSFSLLKEKKRKEINKWAVPRKSTLQCARAFFAVLPHGFLRDKHFCLDPKTKTFALIFHRFSENFRIFSNFRTEIKLKNSIWVENCVETLRKLNFSPFLGSRDGNLSGESTRFLCYFQNGRSTSTITRRAVSNVQS